MAEERMSLTPEQKEAVACPGNLMLSACPGSGKTKVIVSKLFRLIEELRGSSRAVACITYTNAAVFEIESRIRLHLQPGDDRYYDVGTVHSFCLNHIFRPFCHRIPGFENGFQVLTPDSEFFEEFVSKACAKFGRFNLTFKDLEEFTQLRIDTNGKPCGDVLKRGFMTPELAHEYWRVLGVNGYIDFANIIYFSLVLLRRSEVLDYVAARFSWILVDEFQDTSDLQTEILGLIASRKQTQFLLVGDTMQSIFGFTGARPDLADSFAAQIGARTDVHLSGNFRSSGVIVAHANRLFPRTPKMVAVGRHAHVAQEPVWKHGSSVFEVITDFFLPAVDDLKIQLGESAILAPSWFPLFPLGRQLREYGISVVGPGARPYRRSREFAQLAEQVCGYLTGFKPESIAAIERTLFNTLQDITGRSHFELFSYNGRLIVCRLLEKATYLQDTCAGAVAWLDSAALEFSSILWDEGLITNAERMVFTRSVEDMKADMEKNKVDLANLAIDELGLFASPDAALKLSSLHHAKGREYDAVAMIDLHEGKIPFYQARSQDEIDEAKRLFYVGVTRARKFLLYVTDESGRRNGPTRFLKNEGVGIV